MIEAAEVRLEIQSGAADVRTHDVFNPVHLPVQHRDAYEDDRAQPDEQAGSADTITRDASRFAHAYIHMALPRAEVFSLGPGLRTAAAETQIRLSAARLRVRSRPAVTGIPPETPLPLAEQGRCHWLAGPPG